MMKCVRDMDYAEFQLARAPDFKLRVGVSTGKVIAGVVGAQKPLYDIWGDTVNIASRMDYTGERGRIHLPEVSTVCPIDIDNIHTSYGNRYIDAMKPKGCSLNWCFDIRFCVTTLQHQHL